ncbi:hypothetical protein SAMN05444166_6881 [Singulisphaera sp. GP187]|uniref:hypothetical protein n=1 Tax=Singulisphaera sp. GP187 TaxID=1882752 RepID=UPI0009265DD3|nr:hypothetical protein [Singulisphaera sp. GP187]SIO61870.1 hypothetical protein SAMN05444166_6881 [Singulisphaera sp. GP187]
MSEHVIISCSHCQRELRVRVEYLGQKVVCNHCGYFFVAEARAELSTAFVSSLNSTPSKNHRPANAPPTTASQDQEREQNELREEVLRLKTENERLASRFVTANYQRVSLQMRAEDLESQLQRALEHLRLIQDELAASEADRSELSRLRVEAFALREAAMHTLQLENELHALQQRARERQAEYEASVALHARIQEEAEMRAAATEQSRLQDIARLNGELIAAHTSLQAQSLENEAELARATQERDLAVRDRQQSVGELELARHQLATMKDERDRLQGELQTLGAGLTRARAEIEGLGKAVAENARDEVRIEAEHENVSRLRNELQTLVGERERSLEDQLVEVAEKRQRLDFEHSAFKSRRDRDREEGLARLERVAEQLASIRRERDDLFQTLQQTRREFETFKNRRFDENEAQGNRERELRSIIDRLQSARRPPEQ